MASVAESTDKAATTETQEDTPLYREKPQQLMGFKSIAAATRKKNMNFIVNFVQKRF